MSEAFGRDAGSAVSPLPGVHVLAAVPSAGRTSFAGGPARAPQAATTEGLYERHAAKIFGYCLHQLGSREEAEDAVQTTFMNAFRALGRGVVPEAESAWLFKIAENVCLSRRRSSWRRGRIESPSDFDVIEEVVPGPSRQRDELIGIEDALASMPEQQRRAILLREWQGLSYREIGEELEVSQSAVETLIFRARRSLAQGLEQPDLAKKPKRKSFRRALHVIDLGTFAAAAKTLLAGSVAVKATAAAVAVTAAATAASVTPKLEGHSPAPAQSPATLAAPAAKRAAGLAVAVAAPSADSPSASVSQAAASTEKPARTARLRAGEPAPMKAVVAAGRPVPSTAVPAEHVTPVQLPVTAAPAEQAPPPVTPTEAAPAESPRVEQPAVATVEAPKHEPTPGTPERPAAEHKQEKKHVRQRGAHGKRRESQPVPVVDAATQAPTSEVVVPDPVETEAPTEHELDGGEPRRDRGTRRNRRERHVSVAIVTVPEVVGAIEPSDVAPPAEVPGVEAPPEPEATTPAAEPAPEEPASERNKGKRRRR